MPQCYRRPHEEPLRAAKSNLLARASPLRRVETTVAQSQDFKVFRPLQDRPHSVLAWRPLRKGVADLHRRGQLSQRANEAYLQALAAVDDSTPLATLLDAVSRYTATAGAASAPSASVTPSTSAASGRLSRRIRHRRLPQPRPASPASSRLQNRVGPPPTQARGQGQPPAPAPASARPDPQARQQPPLPAHRQGQLLTAALFAARKASVQQLLAKAA